MRFVIDHACYQLANGRWVAKFHLEHMERSAIVSTQCFDPRADLTFETEEEAKSRNRQLAVNSLDPRAELCEWSDVEKDGEHHVVLLRRGGDEVGERV
jgi:hypothetical protein